ncbi:hypothetical protein [Streptomyces sp. NPDC060022]|uniref:hypothetical protein n=1 Tax=Streptomyces sp. NPDC060022 TaxID=3347039 RepID=UPI0036BDC82F
MSLTTSRRRFALRTAVATAALTGMVLAPAATAFADTTPKADSAASTTAEGALVRTDQLKGGLTAKVYRHGDTDIYYTAVVLKGDQQLGTLTAGAGHAAKESRVFEGIQVTLTGTGAVTSVSDHGSDGQGPETPAGVLVHKDTLKGGLSAEVYRHGEKAEVFYSATIRSGSKFLGTLAAGHGFKKEETKLFGDISVTLFSDGRVTSVNDHGSDGQGPETPVKCVATVQKDIGAGLEALLTISPSGPSVVFRSFGDGKVFETLDRKHPKLPASAGIIGEILNPDSHTPQLRTIVEGGGHPASVTDFPKLPKGCSFLYGNTPDSGTDENGTQTTVIPKGGVAAGAEYEQGNDHMLVTAGGAAAALSAAGIGFVALRRRRASAGR